MMNRWIQTTKALRLVLGLAPVLAGCDTIDSHTARIDQVELVGMTKADLYSCAGLPERSVMMNGREYVTYDFQPFTPDNSLSATLPLVGGIAFGSGGNCHATLILDNDKVSEIDYAGDTGGFLGHVAECVTILNKCEDHGRRAHAQL